MAGRGDGDDKPGIAGKIIAITPESSEYHEERGGDLSPFCAMLETYPDPYDSHRPRRETVQRSLPPHQPSRTSRSPDFPTSRSLPRSRAFPFPFRLSPLSPTHFPSAPHHVGISRPLIPFDRSPLPFHAAVPTSITIRPSFHFETYPAISPPVRSFPPLFARRPRRYFPMIVEYCRRPPFTVATMSRFP